MPPRCSRTRASRPTHIHHENAQIRPSAFFAPRARLDIYRFNLPWPCLIMESSFRPATARSTTPLKQTFLCLHLKGGGGCSANRLWNTRVNVAHVSRDGDYTVISELREI